MRTTTTTMKTPTTRKPRCSNYPICLYYWYTTSKVNYHSLWL
jgi:hypothetical protein